MIPWPLIDLDFSFSPMKCSKISTLVIFPSPPLATVSCVLAGADYLEPRGEDIRMLLTVAKPLAEKKQE